MRGRLLVPIRLAFTKWVEWPQCGVVGHEIGHGCWDPALSRSFVAASNCTAGLGGTLRMLNGDTAPYMAALYNPCKLGTTNPQAWNFSASQGFATTSVQLQVTLATGCVEAL